VRRFALAVLVALLTFSASGVSSLVVQEPCGFYEVDGRDANCPPTCVTCGCCHQAVDVVLAVLPLSPHDVVTQATTSLPRLLKADPRGILHVPKSLLG
jgi:hypothetical protein